MFSRRPRLNWWQSLVLETWDQSFNPRQKKSDLIRAKQWLAEIHEIKDGGAIREALGAIVELDRCWVDLARQHDDAQARDRQPTG